MKPELDIVQAMLPLVTKLLHCGNLYSDKDQNSMVLLVSTEVFENFKLLHANDEFIGLHEFKFMTHLGELIVRPGGTN